MGDRVHYPERPSSEQLVDLHVYLVPTELWRINQQSAVNQIINDTISLGFIRVAPEAQIASLRNELENQLGYDLPRDYVFLKSVGRCLARLRPKQEYQIKVKNFLPPQAYAPEIFILEATQDVQATFPSSGASSERSDSRNMGSSPYNNYKPIPPIGNGNYSADSQRGTLPKNPPYHTPHIPRLNFRNSPSVHQHTQTGRGTPLPYISDSPRTANFSRGQSNRSLYSKSNTSTQTNQSDLANGSNVKPVPNHNSTNLRSNPRPINHVNSLDDAAYDTTPAHDQITAQDDSYTQANMSNVAPPRSMAHNAHGSAPLGNETPLSAFPPNSPQAIYHMQSPPGARSQPEEGYLPPLSATPPHTPENQYNGGLDDLERRRLEEMMRNKEIAKTQAMDTSAYRSDAEHHRDRHPGDNQTDSHPGSNYPDQMNTYPADDQNRGHHGTNMTNGVGHHDSYRVDDNNDPRDRDSTSKHSGHDNESADASRRQREEEERRRREWEEDERRRREAERNSYQDDEDERQRREAEERRRREEEEARRRQMARASERPEDREREKERLKRELELAKEDRKDIERKREELVKKAKALQAKTQQKRNQVRDNWKKKYFEEKKKTSPLEEQSNRLKAELDGLHKRIMSTLEGPKDSAPKRSYEGKPSQQSNYKMQATKLQHEIEDLQRRADNIKMKLTAEMKLRNQAETELRALRAELTQKKINLSLTRGQQVQTTNPSREYLFNQNSPHSPMITQR